MISFSFFFLAKYIIYYLTPFCTKLFVSLKGSEVSLRVWVTKANWNSYNSDNNNFCHNHIPSHISQYGRTWFLSPWYWDGGGLSDISCRGQSSVSWLSKMSQISQNILGADRRVGDLKIYIHTLRKNNFL